MGSELPDDDAFERALKWILDGIEADVLAHADIESVKRPTWRPPVIRP